MTIQEQAKEIVERNKGNVKDTMEVLNQLILINSILSIEYKEYIQSVLDYVDLKIHLQKELINYKKKNEIIVIKCPGNKKGICKRFIANICKYSKDCMIPKNLDGWELLKQECEHNQPFSECEICGNIKINKLKKK